MRILRGSGPPLRVVATAGNHIAATPASLSQRQRRLYRARARASLSEVFDHALRYAADLVVSAGGLWGDNPPGIDDLRLMTRWAQQLTDEGVVLVALDDAPLPSPAEQATALDYLAELGLLHVIQAGRAASGLTLDVRGTPIAITADPAAPVDLEGAGAWRILLACDPEVVGVVEDGLAAAHIVILGDRPAAAQQPAGRSLIIRPGWSAPALGSASPAPGFTCLELDDSGVRSVEFVRLGEAAPARVCVPAASLPTDSPGAALRQRLEAEAGRRPLVTLALTGSFERPVFHGLKLRDLMDAGTQADTVLAVDLSQLNVAGAGLPGERRPSFVVEARRAAEELARTAGAGDGADEIRQARASVLAAFQRSGDKEHPA